MDHIPEAARQLLSNDIIRSMSVIDWGKAMARCNEIIQLHLLRNAGLEAQESTVKNNNPGSDLVVQSGSRDIRIQSKLRQVNGKTPFSKQTHFETTRRHSKKNEGDKGKSGHVAYSRDEFDYVMISLIHNGARDNVNDWHFSFIPVDDLVDPATNCCRTHIPASILKKYEWKIGQSVPFKA